MTKKELKELIRECITEMTKHSGPAPAVFIGIQSGEGVIPDFELYNLTQDVGEYKKDSTLSRESLEDMGFYVPERPEVHHKSHSNTHHVNIY
jgi:hypothetical protein